MNTIRRSKKQNRIFLLPVESNKNADSPNSSSKKSSYYPVDCVTSSTPIPLNVDSADSVKRWRHARHLWIQPMGFLGQAGTDEMWEKFSCLKKEMIVFSFWLFLFGFIFESVSLCGSVVTPFRLVGWTVVGSVWVVLLLLFILVWCWRGRGCWVGAVYYRLPVVINLFGCCSHFMKLSITSNFGF